MKAALFAVGLVSALVSAQPALSATPERRFSADPQGIVEIVNVSGEVQVRGWDKPEVVVTADDADELDRVDIRNVGRLTIIKVRSRGRSANHATDLQISVPRDSTLTINTVSGSQDIQGVRGMQRLQAVSGTIVTEAWPGDFEAKTMSGEILVRGRGGEGLARITTMSGDIRIEDTGQELDLNTVSGDVNVTARQMNRAHIQSTNGDVTVATKLASNARFEAETVNGELHIMLLDPIDAEFEIETFNGEIDNCFGPRVRDTRGFGPGKELRFQEGGGRSQVRLKTLNGTVALCRKK